MELMADVREHYSYAHPASFQSHEVSVPIRYVSAGVPPSTVSDLLQSSSERCSVIAIYGKIVIEAYITYLAVRAGWHNSQVATTMLYHLIMLNPHRDITLHVAANNPAMVRFTSEEFITGFYEDYLDSQSRASMNAFRLRLRR
ncbi:hypothetical protein BDR07DRAFT_1472936 [Suillus spraguei]|nr:hypothetical protein BDR07DRAFT_1472936 [Suillus spraguei]